jgi:hypothetical protein
VVKIAAQSRWISRRSSSPSGRLRCGMQYVGVRWKTVRCRTSPATVWITCTPVAPVPTTPTRLPESSTPAAGQRPVWWLSPANASIPG